MVQPGAGANMRSWHRIDPRRVAVPAWCAVLTVLVGAPLLRSGYVLSYDMVWVPTLDLDRPEIWGLGSALPRAVPSDAVVALLGAVLPAALVQRVVLLGALFLLALGTGRLLRGRSLVAQLAGATLAVWNPFVAERLVLGQWPLLIGVAALPWLISAAHGQDAPRWPALTLALAATALSPATGVMGMVVVLSAGWRHGPTRLLVLAGLVNAPWVVSGLLHHSDATSDPAAIGLFDVQGEGVLGRLGAVLTLGGVWNTDVVPTSRTLPFALVLAVGIGTIVVVGLATMWRDDRSLLVALAVPGAVGLLVALSGWIVPDLVARLAADVPGGGLVRDGTRWLALLVPLEAVAFGAGAGAVFIRARHTVWKGPALVACVILPLLALPDLAWGVGGRLEPTSYPSSWASARQQIERGNAPGDVLVLPFSSYRRPSWNDDTPVLDPAGRYFGRTTVTTDELVVSGRAIRGEDSRAASIGRVLAKGGDVPAGLARRGIRYVLVETDAPAASEAVEQMRGERELPVAGEGVRLFRLEGVKTLGVDPTDRTVMTAVWVLAGLTVAVSLARVVAGAARATRRRGKRAIALR